MIYSSFANYHEHPKALQTKVQFDVRFHFADSKNWSHTVMREMKRDFFTVLTGMLFGQE